MMVSMRKKIVPRIPQQTKEEVEDMDFELKDGSNGDQFELEGISPTCLLQLSFSWFMHEVTQVWLILNVVKMIAMDQN